MIEKWLNLNNESEPNLKRVLELCVQFAVEYRWLTGAFVLDFYTEDHWSSLPSEWRDYFESVELEEFRDVVGSLVLGLSPQTSASSRIVPESLKGFLSTCKCLSLPRQPVADLKSVFEDVEVSIEEDELRGGGHVMNLEHIFRKHVKPKKQHEIRRMAALVSSVAAKSGSTVVDLGSGQGHLARILSFGYGLDVVALEEQDVFADRARNFDAELQLGFKANPGDVKLKAPHHIAYRIDPQLPGSSLVDIKEIPRVLGFFYFHQQKIKSIGLNSEDIVIIGLHTCGDLGPTIMRMFASTAEIRGVCSVACCYMKLTCAEEPSFYPTTLPGFPLGDEVSKLDQSWKKVTKGALLTYEARELACHALESYVSNRLAVEEEREKLKIHGYRAALEKLIVGKFPHLKRVGLRGVKNAHRMTFPDYCREALKKLEEIKSEDVEKMLSDEDSWREPASTGWTRVLIFYLLRLCAAPVIETIVLLDRMFFLYEHGINCRLVPIFDPILSARNHVLVATKST